MLYRLLARARYLTVVPVLGLLAACSSLFVMGGRLILHQLWVAVNIPKGQLTDNPILPTFEVESLQGINLMLVGTGCLTLALGMFSLSTAEATEQFPGRQFPRTQGPIRELRDPGDGHLLP